MPFTDDDLNRLKQDIARFKEAGAHRWVISGEPLDALIARLEAAEIWGACHQELCGKEDCSHHEAWRKAAGK